MMNHPIGFNALLRASTSAPFVKEAIKKEFESALIFGNHEKIIACLGKGVEINARFDNGTTPLTIACKSGDAVLVRLLLQNGSEVNRGMANGASALHIAAFEGQCAIVELLLEHGIDPFAKFQGADLLHLAAQRTDCAMAGIAIRFGIPVDSKKPNGATALHIGALKSNGHFLRFLLLKGANPNSQVSSGATALYVAAERGDCDAMKLLLTHDADPDLSLFDGTTPLYIAADRQKTAAVELLVAHNARVDLSRSTGATPVTVAIERCDSHIVSLLLRAYPAGVLSITHHIRNPENHCVSCLGTAVISILTDNPSEVRAWLGQLVSQAPVGDLLKVVVAVLSALMLEEDLSTMETRLLKEFVSLRSVRLPQADARTRLKSLLCTGTDGAVSGRPNRFLPESSAACSRLPLAYRLGAAWAGLHAHPEELAALARLEEHR